MLTRLHLDATMSNVAVHAEAVALGLATELGAAVGTVATVSRAETGTDRFPPISPCGSCRELLAYYAPDARVLVPVGDPTEGDEELVVRTVADLLPDAAWHRP